MRLYSVLAGLMALVAGCAAPEPIGIVHPLATPHAFQLSLERSSAHPGEIVMAKMTFKNTGAADLWVPPRSQLVFEWKAVGPTILDSVVDLPPSACSGIEYQRVAPAKSCEYVKGFVVPKVSGRILVYVLQEPQMSVPLDVQ